jgi:mannan endo-1,4-beta-mannosidase
MENAVITSVEANLKNVTIQATGLQKSTAYTLVVPKGVVTGPTNVEAPEVRLTFSTVDTQNVEQAALCTPNPSPEAVDVYNFLKETYGNKIISGAMAKVAWNTDEAEMVYATTGKYPAMNTVDYIHLWASPANWIDYSQTAFLEDWWNANGLVSACWHWNVPTAQGASSVAFYTENTAFRPSNALVNGTWENTVMKADLAKMAGYLKLLKDKNIPVIWRPLHEGAGNIYEYQNGTAWFWWGRDGGAAYVALWRYMFDYFQEQGLNNLIWVWTTQTKDNAFYPGDDYVDIVGRDIYNQTSAAANASQFSSIATTYSGKMVALSENGNVAKISEQWSSGAKWLFFMPWYDNAATTLTGHEHADAAWWLDAVANPNVITRDEMPSFGE